jgi:hypothetical protein
MVNFDLTWKIWVKRVPHPRILPPEGNNPRKDFKVDSAISKPYWKRIFGI